MITTRPPSPCDASPFQQPWIDQYRQLLLSEQHLAPSAVSRQTLDGHAVYVLGPTSPKSLTPGLNLVWYIDVRSYALRGMDEIHVSTQGRVTRVLRERLTRYERMPIAAVPARVFRFHAPAGAPTEHMANQPTSCAATFPQLLGLHGQPVVVLAGHPRSLHLSLVQLDINPCSDDLAQTVPGGIWVESTYMQFASPGRAMQLCLATSFARARSVNVAVPARLRRYIRAVTSPRSLTLRIAGQRVTAHYAAYTELDGRRVQALWWRTGGHAAIFVGYQMERLVFFGLVDALVDGRTHLRVARSAQQDLDASTR